MGVHAYVQQPNDEGQPSHAAAGCVHRCVQRCWSAASGHCLNQAAPQRNPAQLTSGRCGPPKEVGCAHGCRERCPNGVRRGLRREAARRRRRCGPMRGTPNTPPGGRLWQLFDDAVALQQPVQLMQHARRGAAGVFCRCRAATNGVIKSNVLRQGVLWTSCQGRVLQWCSLPHVCIPQRQYRAVHFTVAARGTIPRPTDVTCRRHGSDSAPPT